LEDSDLTGSPDEYRARSRAGKNAGGKPKKPKRARVGYNKFKYAPGAGCGTGAGGFKSGNNCSQGAGFNSPGVPSGQGSAGGSTKPAPARKKLDGFGGKKGAITSMPVKVSNIRLAEAEAKLARAARITAKKAAARAARIAAKKAQRKAAKKAARLAAKKAARLAAKKAARKQQRISDRQAAKRERMDDLADFVAKEKAAKAREKRARAKVAPRGANETHADYLKRVYAKDIEKLHTKLDALEAKHIATIDAKNKAVRKASDDLWDAQKAGDAAGEARHTQLRKTAVAEYEAAKKTAVEEFHAEIAKFTQADGAPRLADFRTQKNVKGTVVRESEYAKLDPEKKVLVDEARDFYRSMGSFRLADVVNRVKYSNDAPMQGAAGTHSQGVIKLLKDTDSGVAIHEVAHAVEFGDPALTLRSAVVADYDAKMWAYKARNPNGQWVVHPNFAHYKAPSVSDPSKAADEWHSELGYVRRYCDYTSAGRSGIEVVSVGTEELYRRPNYLRKNAREHFNFMLLTLAGRFH
jgi:hypothetical protein